MLTHRYYDKSFAKQGNYWACFQSVSHKGNRYSCSDYILLSLVRADGLRVRSRRTLSPKPSDWVRAYDGMIAMCRNDFSMMRARKINVLKCPSLPNAPQTLATKAFQAKTWGCEGHLEIHEKTEKLTNMEKAFETPRPKRRMDYFNLLRSICL